jgi:predicted GTPase
MGDLVIRLIDTPGIGDTRGIEQDKRNFADILSTLASFDKLHGILILLKPNSARLTLMFKFCVTELLTHLHRDAARNMVFGFTKSVKSLVLCDILSLTRMFL